MMGLDSIHAITLDLYGTLLDVESSVGQAFAGFLTAQGYNGDARDVVRAWEAAYFQEMMIDTLLAHGRTSFEEISRTTLSQVLTRLGVASTPDDVDGLIASRAGGTLFPDVKKSLEQLNRRYTLAVLSNGDLASLERTVANLDLPVDRIISAEQAGVYKPHPLVYRTGVQQLGLEPAQVLHVAAHAWDIRGAVAFGIHGAYISRDGLPFGESPFSPDVVATDLVDLANTLS